MLSDEKEELQEGAFNETVSQFLEKHGVPRLVPILHKMDYRTADDLRFLLTAPKRTQKIIFDDIKAKPQTVYRDWSILHAALNGA